MQFDEDAGAASSNNAWTGCTCNTAVMVFATLLAGQHMSFELLSRSCILHAVAMTCLVIHLTLLTPMLKTNANGVPICRAWKRSMTGCFRRMMISNASSAGMTPQCPTSRAAKGTKTLPYSVVSQLQCRPGRVMSYTIQSRQPYL